MRRLPEPPLLLITDRRQARRPLLEVVEAALEAGCRWISLREKDLPAAEQLALARALVRLGASFGATILVHGAPALALAAGADGVHLPGGSDVAAARARLGPDRWVSLSTHREHEIRGAAQAGADAVTFSPVFTTASKPGHGPALGLDGLARAAARAPLPIIALGGITPANAGVCIEAGAAAVAVMGEVMRTSNPGAASAALIAALARPLARTP